MLEWGIVFFDGDVLVSTKGAMRANLVIRRGQNETESMRLKKLGHV